MDTTRRRQPEPGAPGLTDRELSTSVLLLAGIYASFLVAVIVMNLVWL